MYRQIYARDLVEMIQTQVAASASADNQGNRQQAVNQDLVKYKNYYIDLLLKQSDAYADIAAQIEAE